MSVTLADLIEEIRQQAGIQNSQFLSDEVEMPRIVNLAISNTYDTLVKAYAPYFAKSVDFALDSSGEIELDEIINPAQPNETPLVPISASISTGTTQISMFPSGPLLDPPAYYKILTFAISPASACTTGNTSFQIYVNGVATGDAVTVPSGSSAAQVNSSVNPTFKSTDTVTIKVVTGAPGADWDTGISIVAFAVLNQPRFYKELGVDWSGSGTRLTVPRLSSFMHRNDGAITTVPLAGPYTLHYIPSCPVLDDVTDLPVELERWRDMIILEGQIKVYMKRKMDFGDLRQELTIKKREIEASMRSRVNEPKIIPTRAGSAGCGRSFDIIGSKLKIFPTLGNSNGWLGYRFGFGGW